MRGVIFGEVRGLLRTSRACRLSSSQGLTLLHCRVWRKREQEDNLTERESRYATITFSKIALCVGIQFTSRTEGALKFRWKFAMPWLKFSIANQASTP